MKLTDEEFKAIANDDRPLKEIGAYLLFQACVELCPFGLSVCILNGEYQVGAYMHSPDLDKLVTAPTFEAAVREFARRLCK